MLARLFFLACVGVALPLGNASKASTINISLEDRHRSELSEAFEHLSAGRAFQAEPIFSHVIMTYEKAYDGQEVRCAQDERDAAVTGLLALIGTPEDIARVTKTMKPGMNRIVDSKYQKVTVLGPGWCEAIFGKAFALVDLNRPREAEPLLARVIVMAPTRAHYLNEYAELFKSRGQWQQSYDLFARANDLAKTGPDSGDKNVEARSLRGMGYNKIELGDLDGAEKFFKRSLIVEPENAGAKSELEYIARQRNAGK